jgi:ubiquinone/menaquinone biosynthesis C-methylase UbiE
MTTDNRLVSERFPRSSKYHPEWVLANASGGANSLWLAEWLTSALELRPGMRVLDLGCGKASSSIFLHREFGVQVWATDLWIAATENRERIRDAGAEDGVFPLHADARSLPFAGSFFDAIVCIDAYPYFGTDDLYLNYLAHFVKSGGRIGIAGAALVQEIEGAVPDHLRAWWTQDMWAFHSAPWWRRHQERTGIVDVELADTMPDGWRFWLDWHHAVAPDNAVEIKAIEEDAGRYIGYVRLVGRRREGVRLEEYCWPDTMRSFPHQYTKKPLLRVTTSTGSEDSTRGNDLKTTHKGF